MRAEEALVRTGRGAGRTARPDLSTFTELQRRHLLINTHVQHGTVPGVAVGARFFCRAEMAAVGLHRELDGDVSNVSVSTAAARNGAVSLVVTVGEHRDDGQTLEYPGEGGVCATTSQPEDQQRAKGNPALLDSIRLQLPVRVIREVTLTPTPTLILTLTLGWG